MSRVCYVGVWKRQEFIEEHLEVARGLLQRKMVAAQ